MDRKRRHLVRPVAAASPRPDGSVLVPARVYGAARAARPHARTAPASTTSPTGCCTAASTTPGTARWAPRSPRSTWARPGPAARWLTGEALAEVSVRLQARRPRAGPAAPGSAPATSAPAPRSPATPPTYRVLEQAAEIRFQRLHAPFLDNQVVRACRALPEALRVQPGARAAILRTVLEGAGVADLPPGWGAPSHGRPRPRPPAPACAPARRTS